MGCAPFLQLVAIPSTTLGFQGHCTSREYWRIKRTALMNISALLSWPKLTLTSRCARKKDMV
jgi:hypothetical protein